MKKILILALSTMLILSSTAFAFAGETNDFSKENEIRSKLESSGFEVVSLNKSESEVNRNFSNVKNVNNENTLYFDTVEDFINFVDEIEQVDNSSVDLDINKDDKSELNNSMLAKSSSSYKNGVGKISKYRPFLAGNGILCWKNISFDFKAKWYSLAGYYTLVDDSVKNINSNLSGFTGVDWYQTNAVANYNDPTGLTTEITVGGYYLFGVKIGEFDAGVKYNSSWTFTSKDINKYL